MKRYGWLLLIVGALLWLMSAQAQTRITFAYPSEESELTMRPLLIEMFMEQHPDIIIQEQPVPGGRRCDGAGR